MALYFFYAFLAAGLLNFVCSVLLLRGLAEAGIKVRFFEIRWQVHKHEDLSKGHNGNNRQGRMALLRLPGFPAGYDRIWPAFAMVFRTVAPPKQGLESG